MGRKAGSVDDWPEMMVSRDGPGKAERKGQNICLFVGPVDRRP